MKTKINPTVYLNAAELQAQFGTPNDLNTCPNHPSRYSCINIETAYYVFNEEINYSWSYKDLYAEYFKPEEFDYDARWWEDDENEPRILALLLMYEIAKDLNKLDKKKVKKASSRKNGRNKAK